MINYLGREVDFALIETPSWKSSPDGTIDIGHRLQPLSNDIRDVETPILRVLLLPRAQALSRGVVDGPELGLSFALPQIRTSSIDFAE